MFIMGIAMLMVMMFHQQFLKALSLTFHFGYWGVDVFLFLSGFGIAHSLNQSSISAFSCARYYGRRVCRIMPSCLLAGWVIFFLSDCNNYLCLMGMNLWYIRAIVFMYILSPCIFALIKRWGGITIFCCGTAVCIGVAACLISLSINNGWYGVWGLQRTPVFILGMVFYLQGKTTSGVRECSSGMRIIIPAICFCFFACIAAIVRKCCLCGSPARYVELLEFFFVALATPGICCIIAATSKRASLSIKYAIEWLGKHSLELYLVHECIFGFIKGSSSLPNSGILRLLLALVISVFSAWGLKNLVFMIKRGIIAAYQRTFKY